MKQLKRRESPITGINPKFGDKTGEQSQNSREESWALRQAAATLTARSAALDREVEFTRASLEREREQLKVQHKIQRLNQIALF